jgi:hypothetical protein
MEGWLRDRRSIAVLAAAMLIAPIACGDGGGGRGRAAATATIATPMPATPSPSAAAPTAVTALPSPSATAALPPQLSPLPGASATTTAMATAPATAPVTTQTACECSTATPTPGAPSETPVTPAPTATPVAPQITYFGIAAASDAVLTSTDHDAAGRPVFAPPGGAGISIVVEARRGGRALVRTTYDPSGGARGLDMLVSRPLGNGSLAVCDTTPPQGGVPGTDPPVFSDDPAVVEAIDDLGCRVNDETGGAAGRTAENACTRVPPGDDYEFIDADSDLQYCLPIAAAWSFPVGDTIVAARVRDAAGVVSDTRQIVVRVNPAPPFTCDTGLGERDLTARRPQSRLLTSVADGEDASVDPWSVDPLRICAGGDLGSGIHALTLRDDAIFALPLRDGGILCAKISAHGSTGTLECAGGVPADVSAAQDTDGLTPVVLATGLGVDAGTGAATILAPITVVALPPGAVSDACRAAAYPPPFTGALTTATGTAQLLMRGDGVVAEVSDTGAAFDCAAWRNAGVGSLVLPFPLLQPSADADLAGVIELRD